MNQNRDALDTEDSEASQKQMGWVTVSFLAGPLFPGLIFRQRGKQSPIGTAFDAPRLVQKSLQTPQYCGSTSGCSTEKVDSDTSTRGLPNGGSDGLLLTEPSWYPKDVFLEGKYCIV